jgi:hypothetical protein
MIFVVSDKIFGGGAAVECTFEGLVPQEVAGTFPNYLFSSHYSLWVNW